MTPDRPVVPEDPFDAVDRVEHADPAACPAPAPAVPLDPVATNRAHWDSLAAVHGNGTDHYYDLDALLAGTSSMLVQETNAVEAAIGEPSGRDILHVQCHIGFDTISLARAGARMTGVDFSPGALAKAGNLAERCGVDVEFVEGNAMDLPAQLHGRFDLAYATIGVLGWIGDLDAWMRSVASCLRPGGSLVLVELHPLFGMVESVEPFRLWSGYAYDGPMVDDDAGSYADPAEPIASPRRVLYRHGLGEVVTAACAVGLRIDALLEHLEVGSDLLGWLLTQDDDGQWRYRVDGYPLPVLYALRASRHPEP